MQNQAPLRFPVVTSCAGSRAACTCGIEAIAFRAQTVNELARHAQGCIRSRWRSGSGKRSMSCRT
jgi:hypothetical protein